MPTEQQVLDTFDALGGQFNQPMALAMSLEQEGFGANAVVDAINAAITSGALVKTVSGSLRRA